MRFARKSTVGAAAITIFAVTCIGGAAASDMVPGIDRWPGKPATQMELAPPQQISAQADRALKFALAQVGKQYVALASGAMNTGLETGDQSFDCSGLTWRAYREAGHSWGPMPSYAQFASGWVTEVEISDAAPGDLVFYDWLQDGSVPRGLSGRAGIDHVAMVLDPTAGTVVEAANPTAGVIIGRYLDGSGNPLPQVMGVARVNATETQRAEALPLTASKTYQKFISWAHDENRTSATRTTTSGIPDELRVHDPAGSIPWSVSRFIRTLPKAIATSGWKHEVLARFDNSVVYLITDPQNTDWQFQVTVWHSNFKVKGITHEVTDRAFVTTSTTAISQGWLGWITEQDTFVPAPTGGALVVPPAFDEEQPKTPTLPDPSGFADTSVGSAENLPWVSPELETGRMISYLTNVFTYAWSTEIVEYTQRLGKAGATGGALDFPLAGPSYATCLVVQCETSKVEVKDIARVANNTYEAKVRWRLRTSETDSKQTAMCKVFTIRDTITSRTCNIVHSIPVTQVTSTTRP